VNLDAADLRAYWRVLARRRGIAALVVATAVLVAWVGSLLATPQYRATTTLQIDRQAPDILDVRDVTRHEVGWSAQDQFFETQYRVLASAPVARGAAERLNLDAHPAFGAAPAGPGLLGRLLALLPRRRGPEGAPDPLAEQAQLIRARLDVAPVRDSSLVEVSWAHADAALAAAVANAVADAYIQFTLTSRFQTTDQAEEFLVDQSAKLRKQISELETRLQSYAEAKKIFSVRDSNDLALQALADLSKQRTAARAELARAEAAWRAVQDAPAESLPEVLGSTLIAALRAEYAALEAEQAEQAQRFAPGWPSLITLGSKLEQAARRLELETQRIADQVRASARAAVDRAREEAGSLDRLLADHEEAAQRLRRDAIEYEHLEHEVRKKREALDALLHRENEMALSTKLRDLDVASGNIRVIERAAVPRAPFAPRTGRNVALALVLGLGLAAGLAFLLDHLDNTVGGVADLERITPLPVLAVVPVVEESASARARLARRRAAPERPGIDLVAERDGRSQAAEAFRALRTSILLSSPGQPPRRLVVTSALPEEGKTSTAANLACVLAQLGRRVLIVDADLRRPRLHRVFGTDHRRGLSAVLSGLEPDAARAIVATGVENLDFLPSGLVPPNPSELLNSPLFGRTLDDLIGRGYDHVVIDTPPVLSVSDAVIVAAASDSGVLVVRAGATPRQALRLAAQRLAPAGAAPFGVVLNRYQGAAGDPVAYAYYQDRYADPTLEPPAPERRAGHA